MPPFASQEQYVFAAFDKLDSPYELNVGLGWGLNPSASGLVGKLIYGFKL
jgi:hypothetical protein